MDRTALENVAYIQNRDLGHPDQFGQVISADAVRAQLEKILCNQGFRASQRLKKFLRYIVEETIDGRGDELKEYAIAIDVFQKDSSFDTRADNIVRVEAGRLRSRLRDYYASEGKDDPIKIEFVKGRYAPVFRTTATTGESQPGNDEPKADPMDQGVVLVPQPSPVQEAGSGSAAMLNRNVVICTVAGLLLASFITGWFLWKSQTRPKMQSIVVVPFQNLADTKEDEFFSDGLSDDVIASLSHFRGLRVVARSSAFELKGKAIDVREISGKYNVNSVLEGTVRRYGNGWHITVQLVDSQTGYNLWSQIYERDNRNVLTLHREISKAIATALGVDLGAKIQSFDDKPGNARPEAYQDYLRGLYLWNNRKLSSEERLRESITYFERAVTEDPNYAPAYVWLAKCYAAQWPTASEASVNELIPKTRGVALKALELDGTQGEAYVALGLVSTYEFDWHKAEANFKRALELVPGSAYARQRYSSYLMRVGRSAESALHAREEVVMDPVFLSRLGIALYHSREFDEAMRTFNEALVLDPDDPPARDGLGMVYIQKGLFDKGIAEIAKAGPSYIGDLGYGYSVSGDKAKARKVLTDLLDGSRNRRGSALAIARIYVGLGEKEKALEWLSKAVAEHDFRLVLPTDPVYDSLRSDLRYDELLRQMKLK